MSSDNRRIAKNSIFLYFRMLLIMSISLYTSRVILTALGVEDYGIYNVVGGIVNLFAFINGAMSLTTQRYVAYELGKGGNNQVRRIFNTCVMIHILIAILIIILSESVGLYLLEVHFTIPPERMTAARWVYQLSILSCVTMILSTPYNGAIVAYERMQTFAYISLLETVLCLVVALIIRHGFFDNLIVYAILLSLVKFVIQLCYIVYCRKKIPEIQFTCDFDRKMFKQMLSFTSWTLFNNGSIIACGQGINILLNIFFNPVVNAARAIAVQVETAVASFSKNLQMAMNPQIIKSYATRGLDRYHSLIMISSKYAYFLMLLLSFPILLETDYVLELWLKIVPDYSVQFIRIILLIALVNTLSEPLNAAVTATGKVKYFQAISGVMLIGVLPVSFYLFKVWPYPSVVFAVYLTASVAAYLYKLYYAVCNTGLQFSEYLKNVIARIAIVTMLAILLAIFAKHFWEVRTVMFFWGATAFYEIFILLIIWQVGLTRHEKDKIKKSIKNLFFAWFCTKKS